MPSSKFSPVINIKERKTSKSHIPADKSMFLSHYSSLHAFDPANKSKTWILLQYIDESLNYSYFLLLCLVNFD